MDWSDVTYDIPLPKRSKKQKKLQNDEEDGGPGTAAFVERIPKSHDKLPDLASNHRRILNGLSGSVKRGEMVAILGASGAGKTTLLNVLSARLEKKGHLGGQVQYKGRARDPATWKRIVGYVEQDDLHFGCLTVRETLSYAARLRLPDALFSAKEKQRRVDETIGMLRLEKCQNTRMGGPTERGVSGGERKRTSIGVELVSDVSLLLLDEPTSGLDAFAAWSVIENLREVTRERNLACLMTIHQPSWRTFCAFDRVILLTRGTAFFEGAPRDAAAWFASQGYTPDEGMNPADFFINISQNLEKTDEGEERIEKLLSAWQTHVRHGHNSPDAITPSKTPSESDKVVEQEKSADVGELRKRSIASQQSQVDGGEGAAMTSAKEDTQAKAYRNWPTNWFKEFFVLFRRSVTEVLRNPVLLYGALFQTFILLIVIGFAFFRLGPSQKDVIARIGILYFLPVNGSFAVLFPIVSLFPLSRQIMKRERYAGLYRTSSFYLGKICVEVPNQVLQRLLFYIIIYWMIGLNPLAGKFFIFVGVNLLQILTAVAQGFMIAAVSPTPEIASMIAPALNVIFLLFGGNLLPAPPPWFVWLRWISPITYCYLALGQNEFEGAKYTCDGTNSGNQCFQTGEDVLQQYHLQAFSIGECCGFLLAIFFAFTFIGYVLLRITAHPRFRFK